MDLSRVERGERIAVIGGLLLAVGLFLKWYDIKHEASRPAARRARSTLTGWETHRMMRWLLLAAAVAPLILAYIIARDHTLSWPRGELTSVVAIAAFGLVFYNGVIDRPGDSSTRRSSVGWFVALARRDR